MVRNAKNEKTEAHQQNQAGRRADADLQIAATAVHHSLELVTGNVRHFQRIPGIRIEPVLDEARKRG